MCIVPIQRGLRIGLAAVVFSDVVLILLQTSNLHVVRSCYGAVEPSHNHVSMWVLLYDIFSYVCRLSVSEYCYRFQTVGASNV